MSRNILLETLVEMSKPEEYHAHFYQTEPTPNIRLARREDIFHINGVQSKISDAAQSDGFGFVEYGELMKNAYVKHLELRFGFKRGRSSGPTRLQAFNWWYTQELEPSVLLGFDLDLDKNYLRIHVGTIPGDSLRNRVIEETQTFMKQAGISRKEAPQRFAY